MFDKKDLTILNTLQKKGRSTNQEVAEIAHMATSPCWRRVKQFEDCGLIKGYRAVLDRKQLGLGILAFIRVKIDSHSQAEALQFEQAVKDIPQVIACYAIAGSADFLLQVVAKDLEHYSEFAMSQIRRLPGIKEMESTLVLKEIKVFEGFPTSF